MLEIYLAEAEYYSEQQQRFVRREAKNLQFEHSLQSVSKWEAIHRKAFLTRQDKTPEEHLSYIQAMRLDQFPKEAVHELSEEHFRQINSYINSSQTATTFQGSTTNRTSSEVITSELIYHWMTSYQIPFECDQWHLDRLLTLIRVCSIKSAPPKKMRRSEILARNRSLNEQRLARLGTTG